MVAFTGKGLRGNPAGVCLLTQPLPAARLQAIANEIGLPETSFVWDDGDMTAIRWFTRNARSIFAATAPWRRRM